jgi:hypothetical protein
MDEPDRRLETRPDRAAAQDRGDQRISRQVRSTLTVLALVFGISIAGYAGQPTMQSQLGKMVTLGWRRESRKLGAALRGDGFDVWIDRLDGWPSNHSGRRVRVTGILEERHDLPVYIQRPGDPPAAAFRSPKARIAQGEPRYIVRNPKWSLIQ